MRQDAFTVERDWTTGGAESPTAALAFRDHGTDIEDLKRGETVGVRDCRTDPRTLDNAAVLAARSARAFVNTPAFERGAIVCGPKPVM
ncbi:hypothetical protein MKK75_21310 [Methylobacterium sp. J-030]|uniref:hypothetical protein n=1 Tax=Methylobacterium sp. J-030 TaxID=2836627 RepID=UPI001FB9B48D|nr:hypothetical protein [Methylobacterium sp. J-030]MCJ2071300.1 hypothetical protein [Methylobacterium sp. J-030]